VVVALVALTCLGLARVAIAAKVAETSIDAARLEREVTAETRVADKLELDRSLLVTPSRIESMAAGLEMTEEAQARYISLPSAGAAVKRPGPKPQSTPAAPQGSGRRGARLSSVLGTALELTEREARVLLVGDAALAASR
jgi:hypothetical protein